MHHHACCKCCITNVPMSPFGSLTSHAVSSLTIFECTLTLVSDLRQHHLMVHRIRARVLRPLHEDHGPACWSAPDQGGMASGETGLGDGGEEWTCECWGLLLQYVLGHGDGVLLLTYTHTHTHTHIHTTKDEWS